MSALNRVSVSAWQLRSPSRRGHVLSGRGEGPLSGAIDLIQER
jgi:hypothetical protein